MRNETPLAQAERHVREAEARILRQHELISRLAREGHDTAEAEKLLRTLLQTLAPMRDHLAMEQRSAEQPE
ncbi:MAG: hypothetical protein JOZ79_05210 [Sphingomonas sp.]|nr:hypothetical protein [Sphingomonas sp.]